MYITESGFLGAIGEDLEWGEGTIKLHWKKLGVDGKKAATQGYKGRRQPGSWHNSPAKKGKNRQSISPPKNKSTYIISSGVVEIVVLNLLHQGCSLQWLHFA